MIPIDVDARQLHQSLSIVRKSLKSRSLYRKGVYDVVEDRALSTLYDSLAIVRRMIISYLNINLVIQETWLMITKDNSVRKWLYINNIRKYQYPPYQYPQ